MHFVKNPDWDTGIWPKIWKFRSNQGNNVHNMVQNCFWTKIEW